MPLSFVNAPDQNRESFWRRHILAQRSSPLGIAEYCRRHSLRSPTFYLWRKRLGLKASADSANPTSAKPAQIPTFVAVERPAPACAPPLSLHLPGGRRLDIASPCDASLLRTVLEVLEGRPC